MHSVRARADRSVYIRPVIAAYAMSGDAILPEQTRTYAVHFCSHACYTWNHTNEHKIYR